METEDRLITLVTRLPYHSPVRTSVVSVTSIRTVSELYRCRLYCKIRPKLYVVHKPFFINQFYIKDASLIYIFLSVETSDLFLFVYMCDLFPFVNS